MELLDAIAGKDRKALAELGIDDVVFHSPGTTYNGREQVMDVLGVAPGVLANLRATREPLAITVDETLTFITGSVEDKELDGVLIEARNETGRVAEITMLLRPLSAVQAGVRHLARALAKEAGG
jgi:hypothetical protein